MYDQQEAGEASAQPHLRTPPLRQKGDHLQKFITLCLRRTSTPDDIDDSDVYVISDAGKQGNTNLLLNSLQDRAGKSINKKNVRAMTLILSEDSLMTGGDKKGYCTINQVQTWYKVTKCPLQLNIHSRLFTPGASNRGNVIGPLNKPAYESHIDNFIVIVKDKYEIFGRHGPRIPVGGGVDSNDPDDDGAADVKVRTRAKTDEEPLLYHAVPTTALRELLHSLDAVACISLAGEGKMAFECILRRIPYFGLAFTPAHVQRLTHRIEASVFAAMQDAESKLFQPALAKLLADNSERSMTPNLPGVKRTAKSARTPGQGQGSDTPPQKKSKSEGGAIDLMAEVRKMAMKAAAGSEGDAGEDANAD